MSVFTKRRLAVRKKQEEDRKRWDENIKKSEESMNNILKACEIIKEKYPKFGTLKGKKRVKLFAKVFNEVTRA